jgi:hypothetical protein
MCKIAGNNPDDWVLKVISAAVLIIAVLVMSLLFSCNPVKRVLLNDEYYKIVTDKFVSEGGCVNDTVFNSDTTVLFDTLYSLDFKTDTFNIFNEKVVVQTKYKTIEKKVIIRDTAVVTDHTRIKLLNDKLVESHKETVRLTQQIKDEQLNYKEQRQRANKWRFYFWALIIAAGIYTFRKPILQLITKIKI